MISAPQYLSSLECAPSPASYPAGAGAFSLSARLKPESSRDVAFAVRRATQRVTTAAANRPRVDSAP